MKNFEWRWMGHEPWLENFLELVRTLALVSLSGIRPCAEKNDFSPLN